MKRLTLLLALLISTVGWASAQTAGKVVSGTVIAGDDNHPIAGATVRAKVTKGKGALTDVNGKFRLVLPDDEKEIIVSFVGYETKVVKAGKDLRIVLPVKAESLDEVIVVAYGTSTKQAFTGSSVTVSGEKLKLKSTNITKALEGEVPGVQVITRTGQPGSPAEIIVRGIGSVNSDTSPLYVVDGTPYGNSMTGIDPNDIENISVLKDASATALYGSRAANGVVLITTRKGRQGKVTINAEVKYGINKRTLPLYDVITSPEEYMELSYRSLENKYDFLKTKKPRGQENASINELLWGDAGISPKYNMWNVPEGEAFIDPNTHKVNPRATRIYTPENWKDHVFRTGQRTEATVSMSGGQDNLSFFTSAGFLRDQGYYISSDFSRFNVRNNLTYNVSKDFKNTMNISYTRTSKDYPGQGSNVNNGFAYVNDIPPIYPVYQHELKADGSKPAGRLVEDPKIPGGYSYDYGMHTDGSRGYGAGVNPAGAVRLDRKNRISHLFSSNYTAEYLFLENFKFAFNVGYQQSLNERNDLVNPYYGDAEGIGRMYRTNSSSSNLTVNQILSWNKSFGTHHLDAFVAHETYSYKYKYAYTSKDGAVMGDLPEFDNYVTPKDISSYSLGYNLESYFGQVRYDYANKYFFSGSLRADGSSRFAKGNRWGVFGSVGAAWMLSNEEFMKDQSIFNTLKLKASWGRIGNQEITLGYGSSIPDYFLFSDFLDMQNLGNKPAFSFYSKGNPSLTWEVSNSINVGMESRLLNALTLNVDWFARTTTAMLFKKQVAPSLGYAYYPSNDGNLLNTGIEVDMKWDIFKNNDWTIGARLNMAHYRNVLTQMPKDEGTGEAKQYENHGAYGWMKGHSIYDHYTYTWMGVDKENGKPLYKAYRTAQKDEQGKPIMENGKEVYKYITDMQDFLSKGGNLSEYKEVNVNNPDDAVKDFVGKTALPDLTGGFGFDVSYKGIALNTSFAFGIGGYSMDHNYRTLMHSGNVGSHNWHTDIRKAWTPTNKDTDVPMLTSGVDPYKHASISSTRFLTSRSYLTVSNVRLSYQIPQSWSEQMKIGRLSLYLSGDNIYTFTKRRGFFSLHSISGGNDNNEGSQTRVTQRYLPVATFTAGVQIGI